MMPDKLSRAEAMALVFAAKSGVAELALELERQGLSEPEDALREAQQVRPLIQAAELAAWEQSR